MHVAVDLMMTVKGIIASDWRAVCLRWSYLENPSKNGENRHVASLVCRTLVLAFRA